MFPIVGYYEILEDWMIAERIEPLTESRTRKKLTKSSRYLFFDLGARRARPRLPCGSGSGAIPTARNLTRGPLTKS